MKLVTSRNDNLLYWINKKNETHEKYRGTWIELNDSEKIKKIFLDSSPHRQPAQKGEGVRVENIPRIYSAGKYPVLAICVRTQIDFYITGCIVTPPNNKTRLKRLIYVHNGHYTRKRNRNTAKSVYLCTILLQTCIFMHKNALNPPRFH